MSKMIQALESLQENQPNGPHSMSETMIPEAVTAKDRVTPAVITLLWLVASITATVFSYSLGVKQGMEKIQTSQTPDWTYYFPSDYSVGAVKNQTLSSAVPVMPSVEQPQTPQSSAPAEMPASLSQSLSDAAEAPAVAAESSVLKAGFTIQAATYQSKKRADDEVLKLAKQGVTAFVLSSGKFFVLCLDSFETRSEAAKKLAAFISQGYQKTYPGAYVRAFKRN